MKLADPSHKEILPRLLGAFADKDGGAMPDQSNPHYEGLSRCWNWHGQSDTGGYALIPMRGISYLGHRVSYFLHHGHIPDGLVIRHRCDNKICTNPEHLELGTHQQNIQDAHKRGLVKSGKAKSLMEKAENAPFLVMSSVINSLDRHTFKIMADDLIDRSFGMFEFHNELKQLLADCFAVAFPDRKFLHPRSAKKRIESIQPIKSEDGKYPMLEYWIQEIDDERRY